jgi:hypothetical protein
MMMTMMIMIMMTPMMMMMMMMMMEGDGDHELTLYSNMCVQKCALRAINLPSRPASWTATQGSTTGHHHWPALFTPLAKSTGNHHWSAPLAGIIGQDPSQHVLNTSMTARAAFWNQNAG